MTTLTKAATLDELVTVIHDEIASVMRLDAVALHRDRKQDEENSAWHEQQHAELKQAFHAEMHHEQVTAHKRQSQ